MKRKLTALFLLAAPALTFAAETAAEVAPHGEAHADSTPFAGTIAQSLAAIFVFLVVFFVLRAKAWGPILKGLQDREGKIKGDLEAAEAANRAAQARLEEYNKKIAESQAEMRAVLAKAQADGEQLAANIRTKAMADAEEAKERATKEIEAAKDAALREIYAQTAELSTSIAEKILRRSINAQDQQDLVRASVEQLQAIKN